MKSTFKYTLFSLAIFIYSNLALAQDPPLYLWSDEHGFEVAQECEIQSAGQIRSENLRTLAQGEFTLYDLPPIADASGAPISLEGTEWQVHQEEGTYTYLRCSDIDEAREYLVFEVYLPGARDPLLYAGVHEGESKLFDELISNQIEVTAALTSLDSIVCTASSSLNVRDESLSRVIFQARRHERVKKVQSWGTNEQRKVIGGTAYTFIQVQFPERENRIGWVADTFIVAQANCPGAIKSPEEPVISGRYTFPVTKRTTHNYKTGMRAYKASRSGGTRWHAAADLYRKVNEAVVAVTDGVVIRDIYPFYEGTYALEVRHSDGRVVRYGEITAKRATGIGLGRSVRAGQVIGYIGKVNSGCCNPMLHFELYSGKGTGKLSVPGNKFGRRWDLLNPNQDLTQWERDRFGTSY